VQHFEITEQHCPKKEELEEYFRARKVVDGKLISKNLASQLATLCRPPSAMRGGNRKKRAEPFDPSQSDPGQTLCTFQR
jgi:hypothetical protein